MAQCFRFGCRRCSPLNWALVSLRKSHQKFKRKTLKNNPLVFNPHN
ncbi:acetyltransferase [Vibrio cholerae]|nr:acetyltransferase [Vibrio cholerae]MCD1200453.1 acetyltransferase [Vibrio cholerae]MCD1209634.1 acetyltransferase [Vibrio cholerae]MCD1213021.1 acetyltransferase [Vibrio cholerae]MCD1231394.1 acetyltransferase [Vibrio cholerae]